MKILLLGYMGCGKSTIGKLLAEQLQLPFIDLDQYIERSEAMPIAAIFEHKGEIYFRKKEQQLFSDLMHSQDSFVLSLGGGTPCYANNDKLLQGDQVVSIYLKTSIATLVSRIGAQDVLRPLLFGKSENELYDFIAQHLFERSYFYHQATTIIETDDKAPTQIVKEIIEYLG